MVLKAASKIQYRLSPLKSLLSSHRHSSCDFTRKLLRGLFERFHLPSLCPYIQPENLNLVKEEEASLELRWERQAATTPATVTETVKHIYH